jgi:hypothetical protein
MYKETKQIGSSSIRAVTPVMRVLAQKNSAQIEGRFNIELQTNRKTANK